MPIGTRTPGRPLGCPSRDGTTLLLALSSTASTRFAVDLFVSGPCDPSNHGEGVAFLKSLSVTTDGSGTFLAKRKVPAVTFGRGITATATDPRGNTSEFSVCRVVTSL